jgi:small subunit ribosomal protein S5
MYLVSSKIHRRAAVIDVKNKSFESVVISSRRVSKTTKGGRKASLSVLVFIGNRNGCVGFAMGKSTDHNKAVSKAQKGAKNNLFSIYLDKNGQLENNSLYGKFSATKVVIKKGDLGTGIVGGSVAKSILELCGFQSASCKVYGSKNKISVAKSVISALMNSCSADFVRNNLLRI